MFRTHLKNHAVLLLFELLSRTRLRCFLKENFSTYFARSKNIIFDMGFMRLAKGAKHSDISTSGIRSDRIVRSLAGIRGQSGAGGM